MIRIWNRIIKTWKKRENVQFYQGEAISHLSTNEKDRIFSILKEGSNFLPWRCIFLEEAVKFQFSRCWKKINNHGNNCQEVKNPFSKQLNYEVCIEIFNFWHWAAGDFLTPWHQKLNWSFYHLPHTIYSPALREFEKVWQQEMKDRFHNQDLK